MALWRGARAVALLAALGLLAPSPVWASRVPFASSAQAKKVGSLGCLSLHRYISNPERARPRRAAGTAYTCTAYTCTPIGSRPRIKTS